MSWMRTSIIMLFTGTAFVGGGGDALAKSRSCDADITVELKPRNGFPRQSLVIERFSARGFESTANAARREARDRAKRCARRVWDIRWAGHPDGHGTPIECTPTRFVNNFGLSNIKCRIHDAVCALKSFQGRGPSVPDYAIVWTRVTGGSSACLDSVLHAGNYGVPECSAAARAAECGN